QGADPRPGVELRLRWQVLRRGVVHLLSAQEARRRAYAATAYCSRRRIHDQGASVNTPRLPRHPLTLQTRLMAVVIAFVSLILIIVAVITSATLGLALEGRLQEQVKTMATQTTILVAKKAQISFESLSGEPITASSVLAGQHFPGSAVLLAVASPDGV